MTFDRHRQDWFSGAGIFSADQFPGRIRKLLEVASPGVGLRIVGAWAKLLLYRFQRQQRSGASIQGDAHGGGRTISNRGIPDGRIRPISMMRVLPVDSAR